MTARIKRKRAVRIYELLVFRCIYSNLKPIKALSDFPHKAIGNHLLRFLIFEYGFPVFKTNIDCACYIKGQCFQQVIVCLFCGGALNLRNYLRQSLLDNLLCNFCHLPAVFFRSATMSVLSAAITEISFVILIIPVLTV